MDTARQVGTWRDVDTRQRDDAPGWLAAMGVVAAILAALLLLGASAARTPITFDDVSQLSQAP